MWTAKKITADAANKLQIGAGLLVNKFNVLTPTEPQDQDIVCETTGDYHIVCTPEIEDKFEGINNADIGTKEGAYIKRWKSSLTINALSITEDTIKLALGAADGTATEGIKPRYGKFKPEEFKKLYWLGDMMDENKLFVVVMDDTVSTGGIDFSSQDDGKGGLSLTLNAHPSTEKQGIVPMAFYILTKQEAA